MLCFDHLLLTVILLIVIDLFVLFVYCRLMKKLDGKRIFDNSKNNNISQVEALDNKKRFIKNVFELVNPYLYGWMRFSTLLVGKIPSHRIRNLVMHYIFCMDITKNTVIYGGCEIRSPWNIKANRCVISTYCILDGRNGIIFGEDVVLGGGVHIWTEEHNVNDPFFSVLSENRQPVVIEKHSWVCSDSTILPGVHIGEGAVVATRAVVTHDLEPFSVNVGVPARKISQRNKELKYKLNGKPTWHFF